MLRKLLIGISIFMAVHAAYGYDFSNTFTGAVAAPVENKQSTPKQRAAQPSQAPIVMSAEVFPENSTPAAPAAAPVRAQQTTINDLPLIDDEPSSSEVVSGTSTATPDPSAGIMTSIRPQARPANLTTQQTTPAAPAAAATPAASASTTPAPVNTRLYDMSRCTYSRGSGSNSSCYGTLSTTARATRIMNAAHYVNRLHGTSFDGRYMLCTGYRESNFNPGARGAAGERGMFQVMRDTARGALRYDARLEEFKDMGTDTYLDKMRNSTVAQVELSFLVLKMKLMEDADNTTGRNRRTRIMGGTGTTDDYRRLAGRYNGGGYGSTYASKISSCYSCMRGQISATATTVGSNIQSCLNRAK